MCCRCNNIRNKANIDCQREEKEQISMSTPAEKEENLDELFAQWEKEMEMLEDWLNNPELEDGSQQTVMKILGEENSTEWLKNFILGAEQEITAALEPAAEGGSRQHGFC
jgi:hypothetical protein